MAASLKISSFNCRGLADKVKRNTIFNYLKKFHNSFIFLQETHANSTGEKQWKREWPGRIFFSHGTSSKNGVAILTASQLQYTVHEIKIDQMGRYIILNVDIDDHNYILVNLYAPTKDHVTEQVQVFTEVQNILNNYQDQAIILGGDFNICLNPQIDKCGGRNESITDYTKLILNFMDNFELNDIWRVRNPDAKRYTRRQNTKAGMVHSRIDFFLTSIKLGYIIDDVDIKTGLLSDHALIQIIIKQNGNTDRRGKGFWKFNASLLTDKDYVKKVKSCIKEVLVKYPDVNDHGLLWDLLKCDIRSLSISHSAFITKQRNEIENYLKEKLDSLEPLLALGKTYFEEYEVAKHEYEQIQKHKTRGLLVRSKSKYIEEGERNTKYFLSSEKRKIILRRPGCNYQ